MAKNIKTAIDKVDPKKVYNVSEMRRDGLFPWLSTSNPVVYVNAILDDKLNGNMLKAKITGQGRGREYRIKGENIINFLKSQNDKRHNDSGGAG